MNDRHYTREDLQKYIDPLVEWSGGEEKQISDHLHACEACAALAKQLQEDAWSEVREEFKGFK